MLSFLFAGKQKNVLFLAIWKHFCNFIAKNNIWFMKLIGRKQDLFTFYGEGTDGHGD